MLDCPHQIRSNVIDKASGDTFVQCKLVNEYIGGQCGFVESRCKLCETAPDTFEPGMDHNVNTIALVALDAKIKVGHLTPDDAVPKMLKCGATADNCRSSMEVALGYGRLNVEHLLDAEKHFADV